MWRLFEYLSTSRQSGYGPCPILMMDILAAMELLAVQQEDRVDVLDYIKRMDAEWMQWCSEKNKA